MGDMDGGGAGGASSWDSGDAAVLAGSRAALMGGGSLPPRKRLLAGLKQNGWLSTSPPSSVVFPTAGHVAVGGNPAVGAVEGGVAVSASGNHEEGCMGCNVVEANGMRRIKRGGVSLRLCSSCALLYTKSMFCPHCLAMYHDASLLGDPSIWLVCSRCSRSVHPDCEHKHSGSLPDAATYVCLDCVNAARRHRDSNGVTGMRSKPSSGRSGVNSNLESGSCASAAAAAECSSPSLKKPRMMRERSKPGESDHADASRSERHRLGPEAVGGNCDSRSGTLLPSRKAPSQPQLISGSSHEVAAAAKNAAAVAVKAAAAAKVNAAAKASAAVKAAAAAKAALEAAAHAAKAEAAARAELRRKAANAEPRLAGSGAAKLEIVVHSEARRERTLAKGEVKAEREEGHPGRAAGGGGSMDDEELARQLHRVINSSPRISRSLTPMRRKASVKPDTPSSGVSNSSVDAGRAWPRTGGPSPSEPTHHQFKQQQTRPRSVTHKEFRRLDSRVSRHEVKKAEDATHQTATQQGDAFVQSSPEAAFNHTDAQSSHNIAAAGMKTEVTVEALYPHVQDDASILFDALVEADGENLHRAGSAGSHDQRPDYLQEILEAAVLTDTAMSFNDGANVANPELQAVRLEAEDMGQHNQAVTPSGLHSGENETGLKNTYPNTGEAVVSALSSLVQSEQHAANVLQDVEMQEAGAPQAVPVRNEDVASRPPGTTEVGSNHFSGEQVKGRRTVGNVSLDGASRPVVAGAVSAPGPEDSKPVVSESLPPPASGHTEMGSMRQQNKVKGIPVSSQAFATGVGLAPFGSAAQIPIRTPAFASGPAGRHA